MQYPREQGDVDNNIKLTRMQDFAAIDFETANSERSSVCSVGIVIVRGGEIVDKFYSLIKPEPEYYSYVCMVCALPTQKMLQSFPKCGSR